MNNVRVRVPAKVNLGLAVGPPGDDGYHELVNVFHAVSVFDEVTVHPADAFTVEVADGGASGANDASVLADVPLGEGNLAVRAARLLAGRTGITRGVHLYIRKSIPVAGGMAGGSADAAAALVACDALWNTHMAHADLRDLAGELGSDVAFPLLGGTAVGLGRGEQLTPVDAPATLHWVFALAEGGLSTPAVYGECDRMRHDGGEQPGPPAVPERLLAALRAGDPEAVGAELFNDLQPAALSLRPDLCATLNAGHDHGAVGALVSGSGPTCAFLARSAAHAEELGQALTQASVCRGVRVAHGPVPGARAVSGTASSLQT